MVDAGVGTVAKKLEESTRLRLSYLWNHKSNLEELKKEVERVRDVRADLLSSMERAERRGEQIENDVERWLKNVEECINNATIIIEDFEGRAGIRCCKGLCPDLTTRYRLIKKSVKELKAVSGLLKDRNFDRVSYVIHQRDIWSRYSKDYETFESRLPIFNDIYNALCNDDTNMIGVYGMGGIGKTALVKQVAWQAKEDKLFDEVVLALVSPTPDIRKIQGDIANQLGLQFHEENESGRARRLRDRLNQEKRFLLIFDDIWEILDLERVGIPLGNDHQGCKIMLTSRIHDVSGKMGSQCNFLVAALKEEEAFSLFKNIVGDSIENFEFQSLAVEFVKACGGLPIAIVNIANSLRGKSLFEWREEFQTLSHPSSRKFTRMLEDVCSTIELSYYHLEDEELKSIFLLCGLINYTDEASVMDLLKYGTGLGLFKGIITLEETRDKLYSLVHELKSSCLLLDGHNREWFSMHAIVRYVALSIVYRDQHVSALRIKTIPKDWLNRDTVKSCNAICSHDGDISELTEGLEYPEVEFVYLNLKDSISKIPDNFFSGMTKLSVLSLTKVHLVPLPSSLHLLINLRTLCFNQCVLGDLAGIGDLKKLEILSLVCLDIEHLPREIGQLTKLRLLDLSNCSNLKAISSNVISSLSLLEELYMGNSIVEWAYEGINNERNASLHELKFLSLLTTLELHIRDAKLLPVGLFPKKLKRYKIYIGDEWDWHDKYEYKRTLKLKLNTNIGLENEIVMQLKEIEELYLDEVQGVKNVLYDLDAGGLPKLKHLSVQNNPYIWCIVDSVEWLPCDAFPLLESLFLRNLINLEKICHGELTATFFSNLRMIKVRNCDKLRDFLSISVFRGLPKLQNFELIKCKNMEEIFTIERESEKIDFHQLRFLSLKFLPRLTSFYHEVKSHSAVQITHKELTTDRLSNEVISVDDFDAPMPFFSGKVMFPNLEALELCAINCEMIWPCQPPVPLSFQNFTSLIVRGCDKLKHLFPSFVARNFVQLQHLEIINCRVLEDIVTQEDEAEFTQFVFPQVTFLKLWDLPELRTFYRGRHTSEWPLLKRLELSGCDKVNIFTSESFNFQEINEALLNIPVQEALFLVEKVVTNLEELKLSGKEIMMIFQGQFPDHLFHNLKMLEIMNDRSENFPLGIIETFRCLEKLEVRSSSYRGIFPNGDAVRHAPMLECIKSLKLWKLPDLKYIWEQESETDSILQNLEILEVWWCDDLINLVPSSVSFQNLTILELWCCRRLKSLLAPSTAKSLVRLEKISIEGCEMMTEIIASEVDVGEHEIIFRKLKFLSLENLECLISFCSGNSTFTFPSLEDLFVIECPMMKIFSTGVLETPMLNKVRQNQEVDEGFWQGDLNATIKWLSKEKNVQNFEEGCDHPFIYHVE